MIAPDYLKVPPAAPRMRIGLLGGSFNPAHEAHRRISIAALKRLGLDQVWWLVSPGNPLKQEAPELGKRVAAARAAAHHPRIVVTGFEGATGSAYTVDTIRFLQRRNPQVAFVWLMGADNLAEFHRWRSFEEIFRLVPIAVFDRPGYRLKARASKAAQRFGLAELDESDARGLASLVPPAWTMLTLPLSPLSSTRLRNEGEPRQRQARRAKASKTKRKQAKRAEKPSAKRKAGKRGAKAGKQQARSAKTAVKQEKKAAKRSAKANKSKRVSKAATRDSKKKAKRH